MQTANIFPCNCQFAEDDKSLKGNVILKSTGWELSRWSCIPSWTGWQKLVEGQRQWNSWSCDPISLMTDSMWGRRIWEGDNMSSMQMWIYTKDMSEAIVMGVEVFFAPCPEFRNSMESGIWGSLPNLAWISLRSRFLRVSFLSFCSGILVVKSSVFLKWQIL